jgi:FKBP-type peptidyl-prolyl cis-trans isomerase 2
MKSRPVVAFVLLASLLLLAGCGQKIGERMMVELAYKGTLPDGTVFDESTKDDPLQFMFGVGMMLPGLESGLLGMRAGERKQVEVKAADAYGERTEAAIQEVPREQMPEDMELEIGSTLTAQTPDGPIYATILELKDTTVILDFNHPLAGKDLVFDITVLSVKRPTVEQVTQYTGQ